MVILITMSPVVPLGTTTLRLTAADFRGGL